MSCLSHLGSKSRDPGLRARKYSTYILLHGSLNPTLVHKLISVLHLEKSPALEHGDRVRPLPREFQTVPGSRPEDLGVFIN